MSKFPSALLWLDLEGTGVPSDVTPNNYAEVEIIEIAFIVTDFDLKPYFGFQGVVGMNDAIKAGLAKNPEVVQMHLKNGLLKESKESTDTLASLEQQAIEMLRTKTTQDKKEFMLAGAGIASYDFQMLKQHMPELASWLVYYPLDTSIVRRAAKILSGGAQIFTAVPESYADKDKKHRALDDVKAHLKEAVEMQKTFKWVAQKLEEEG